MEMTAEEFQIVVQQYQQNLANAQLANAQLMARNHTLGERNTALEAAATPKPGPVKPGANA